MRVFALLAIATVLNGCASGYSQFYQSVPGATPDVISAERVGPPPSIPLVERSAPAPSEHINAVYANRGYVPIGWATFTSGRHESEQPAVRQGQKVGADIVLVLNPQYVNSVTTNYKLIVPTTQTSYSTGTATAIGPGGRVNVVGNATTTTYGTTTTNIPITTNITGYSAVYFVKRRWAFGALWRELTDTERQAIESNFGVVVTTVVDGTPAFKSNVLPGDIILKLDGEPVAGPSDISNRLSVKRGSDVQILIRRGDKEIEIPVRLGR